MMPAMQDIELGPLLAFLNSHDLDGVDDWLRPVTYRAWAEQHASNAVLDIPDEVRPALQAELRALAGAGEAVDAGELARARDIRDALLAALIDHGGGAGDALDRLVSALPVRLRVVAGGRVEVEPASRGPLAIAARALILAHDAALDGTWERLGCCRADDCHWVYVDRSKNHSRQWCSMGDCGARAKARAYRARRRAD